MYSLLFVTAYTFPEFFYEWKMAKIRYLIVLGLAYIVIPVGWFGLKHVRNKRKTEYQWITYVLFFCMLLSLTAQYWNTYYSHNMVLIGNALPVCFIYVFFECTFATAYLWEVSYTAGIGALKTLYITFTGTFGNKYYSYYFEYPRNHDIGEIIYWITVCLLAYSLLRRSLTKTVIKRLITVHRKVLFITALVSIEVVLWLLNYGTGKIVTRKFWLTLFFLTFVVFILAALLGTVYGKMLKAENAVLDVRNSVVEAQYKELSVSYERYRCLVHDEKHLVSYLTECIRKNETENALKFLLDFQNDLTSKEDRWWTGIQELDFMLNIKLRRMRTADIDFSCDLVIRKLPLPESDFIVVMGNLLDNAIEATEKCKEKERKINLVIKDINQIFFMKLRNSCVKKAVIEKNKFITDKTEKQKHGLGLESVKYIIERYDGNISFSYDDKNFEVRIIINKSEEN